jgi:hyperosmotically inducible protein
MKTRLAALIAGAALLTGSSLGLAQSGNAAQKNNSNGWSAEQLRPIVESVRKQLLSLPDYSVFDWLTFSIQGHTVVLHGYASRPVLKSEAEKVVKGIQGVESVQNEIKVLPYSQIDDQIRVQTLVRIYGQPALRKYTNAPIRTDLYPTVGRMAGGITQDPPIGYFAIHIVVDNSHTILEGVVDSPMDAEIADVQANSVPGVFSVTDNLIVPGTPGKEKVK